MPPSDAYIQALLTEHAAIAARKDPARRRRLAAVEAELANHGIAFETVQDRTPKHSRASQS